MISNICETFLYNMLKTIIHIRYLNFYDRYCCGLCYSLTQTKIQEVHLKMNVFNRINHLYQFRIRTNRTSRSSVKQDPDSIEDPCAGRQIILDCFKTNPSQPCDYTFSTNSLLLMHTYKKKATSKAWSNKNCLSIYVPALIFKSDIKDLKFQHKNS